MCRETAKVRRVARMVIGTHRDPDTARGAVARAATELAIHREALSCNLAGSCSPASARWRRHWIGDGIGWLPTPREPDGWHAGHQNRLRPANARVATAVPQTWHGWPARRQTYTSAPCRSRRGSRPVTTGSCSSRTVSIRPSRTSARMSARRSVHMARHTGSGSSCVSAAGNTVGSSARIGCTYEHASRTHLRQGRPRTFALVFTGDKGWPVQPGSVQLEDLGACAAAGRDTGPGRGRGRRRDASAQAPFRLAAAARRGGHQARPGLAWPPQRRVHARHLRYISCPTITRRRCGRSRQYSPRPSVRHRTAQLRPSLARKAAESAFPQVR